MPDDYLALPDDLLVAYVYPRIYPIFPPDRNAAEALAWLADHGS